jgi:hypothetical protein
MKNGCVSVFSNGGRRFRINTSRSGGRVAQLGEHLLCKLAKQLQTLYRFIPFSLIYNNLGHLPFAQKLSPMAKADRVLTQFWHSS